MSKATTIPKGALFTVTSGCYSDFHVKGVFRALEPIDAESLRDEWIAKYPDQAAEYHFNEMAFLASLSHLMEQVECWELHLGDYSTASELKTSTMEMD